MQVQRELELVATGVAGVLHGVRDQLAQTERSVVQLGLGELSLEALERGPGGGHRIGFPLEAEGV